MFLFMQDECDDGKEYAKFARKHDSKPKLSFPVHVTQPATSKVTLQSYVLSSLRDTNATSINKEPLENATSIKLGPTSKCYEHH